MNRYDPRRADARSIEEKAKGLIMAMDEAATGLRIGVWVAVIAAIAGIALALFAGWFVTKAIANAAHAVTHAEEWRM